MPAEDFAGEHFTAFAQAQAIYESRSKVRGQMWLESGLAREFTMIREKLERAVQATVHDLDNPEMMKEFEDSLLDLMNFANFAIKKARRGVRA